MESSFQSTYLTYRTYITYNTFMKIIHSSTNEEFLSAATKFILNEIKSGARTIGLSGGSTPKPVYELLSKENIPWDALTFFLLDERYIAADSEKSNRKMIQEAMPKAHLLAPNTSLPIADCIKKYGEIFEKIEPDLVILGMGLDGHIASLFPPVPVEAFGPASVLHTVTDRFDIRDRITVTFPVLENAKKRLFLITGEEKKKLLQKMQDDMQDPINCPAVALFDEKTTWITG